MTTRHERKKYMNSIKDTDWDHGKEARQLEGEVAKLTAKLIEIEGLYAESERMRLRLEKAIDGIDLAILTSNSKNPEVVAAIQAIVRARGDELPALAVHEPESFAVRVSRQYQSEIERLKAELAQMTARDAQNRERLEAVTTELLNTIDRIDIAVAKFKNPAPPEGGLTSELLAAIDKARGGPTPPKEYQGFA